MVGSQDISGFSSKDYLPHSDNNDILCLARVFVDYCPIPYLFLETDAISFLGQLEWGPCSSMKYLFVVQNVKEGGEGEQNPAINLPTFLSYPR